MSPAPLIRPERPADAPRVRALLEAAFGGKVEADITDRMRADGDFIVTMVAEEAGDIAGYVGFLRVSLHLGDRQVPVVALAPVGVLPARQRRGIGSALVNAGLDRIRDRAERLVFVLGDPAYYCRFGFTVMGGYVSRYAGPHFQTLKLAPDAPAAGRVLFPAAFAGVG
jgi:putative acetyltransferase